MKQLKLILIGGGDRGSCYMKYVDTNPEKYALVGIAEPNKEKRDYFKNKYGVPEENCFDTYEELLAKDKFADIAMICTQDKMHLDPALMAIRKKYDLLLEKPISTDAEECFKLYSEAEKYGVKTVVCHVLRYTPFYKALKKIIDDGNVGEITNISHTEGVGNVHISHSYVRGNWRKKEDAAPMILAKCSHDTDLLTWLIGKKCEKVQSFGSLSYFCEKNAPEGAPMRCMDGCPHKDTCLYYAPSLYKLPTAEVQHFKAVVANKFNPTDEEVLKALETSNYGRCVFHCDNDVVDRQTVNMQFGEDVCAVLTMSGFNKGGRVTSVMGTKGEITANMEEQSIKLYSFETGKTVEMYQAAEGFDQTIAGGHGGGDYGIMDDLYNYIALNNPSDSISGMEVSCMSHLIAFAAEKARCEGTVVDMNEFVKTFEE